jgi:hypothetical protein
MSQEFSDLGQRRSLPKHLGGEAMSELMSPIPRRMNPRSYESMSHYGSDGLGTLEACYGCLTTKKYASADYFWPCSS